MNLVDHKRMHQNGAEQESCGLLLYLVHHVYKLFPTACLHLLLMHDKKMQFDT